MSTSLVASDDLAITAPTAYDPVDQEPEADVIIRLRRTPAGPYMVAYTMLVEGQPNMGEEALSQTQRDFISANVRYIAGLIIQRPVPNEHDLVNHHNLAQVFKRCRAEARAMTEGMLHSLTLLVKKHGVEQAAQATELKPKQVEHLLRRHGVEPDELTEKRLKEQLAAIPGVMVAIPHEDKVRRLQEGEIDPMRAGWWAQKREKVLVGKR